MSREFGQIWKFVADDLRNKILKGTISPGTRLKISELASKYKVSETPVREAIRLLSSAGFVESFPRKMVIVKEITTEEMIDVYTIQAVLEGLAAKFAVIRGGNKLIKRLETLNEHMRQYLERNDFDKFVQANQEFHQAIIRASKNEKLIEVLENLRDQVHRFRFMQLSQSGRPKQSLKEHRQILKAFKTGDADLCEKSVKDHINMAIITIKKCI